MVDELPAPGIETTSVNMSPLPLRCTVKWLLLDSDAVDQDNFTSLLKGAAVNESSCIGSGDADDESVHQLLNVVLVLVWVVVTVGLLWPPDGGNQPNETGSQSCARGLTMPDDSPGVNEKVMLAVAFPGTSILQNRSTVLPLLSAPTTSCT